METIIYALEFVVFIFLLWVAGLAIVYGIECMKVRKRQRKGYEQFFKLKYDYIQRKIRELAVTEENYQFISLQILELSELNYQDREKTQVLMDNFYMGKFRQFREREILEAQLSELQN